MPKAGCTISHRSSNVLYNEMIVRVHEREHTGEHRERSAKEECMSRPRKSAPTLYGYSTSPSETSRMSHRRPRKPRGNVFIRGCTASGAFVVALLLVPKVDSGVLLCVQRRQLFHRKHRCLRGGRLEVPPLANDSISFLRDQYRDDRLQEGNERTQDFPSSRKARRFPSNPYTRRSAQPAGHRVSLCRQEQRGSVKQR
jgi:hypothetical protein